MTKDYLFDFYLFHAYSKLSGFLVNVLGLAVFFVGVFSYANGRISALACAFYVIAAIAFLGYSPIQLKLKAARAMKEVAAYRLPMEMTFSEEEGITTVAGDVETHYSWEQVRKGVVTPKTIAVYVSEEDALVIPKVDFGASFQNIFMMITKHLGANMRLH